MNVAQVYRRDKPDRDDAVVLGVLLDDYPVHRSVTELGRELGWENDRVQDALGRLDRSGVAHRHGEFASPRVQRCAAAN